jgi:phosphate transport system substrate-binding protein
MTRSRSSTALRALAVLWLGLLAGFALGVEWIRTRPPAPPPPSGGIDLVGAGATFPYPLYRQWFADYGARSGIRINYFSLGSGEGIRLLLEGSADFGATDRPLTAAERAGASCGPLELPMVVGGVAIAYNVPDAGEEPLRLDADALAGIFLGRITRWDDAALAALNPGRALPALPMLPAVRVRSSGTSAIFAAYLGTSAEWRRADRASGGGAGARWPVGTGVEGNEGVAAQVRATPGAIGFVEHSYATLGRLRVAALRDARGGFVRPDTLALRLAADELLTVATVDTVTALVGARAAGAYPVAGVTRIVADRVLADSVRGAHLIAFARWALDDGARAAAALGYVPLPGKVARRTRQRLDAIRPGTCLAAAP